MEWVLSILAEYGTELGGGAAVLAIVETVFKPFRKLFGRTETVKLDKESIKAVAPVEAKTTATLEVHEFIAIRREMKADLEQELAAAHEDEKSDLRARIAEMEAQIADPDDALAEAQKTIADLTDRLSHMGNDIGGDRLAEAQNALARLDFSVADDIFAEVEERHKLEVQQAARAAFGRGEVAEAEIRWHDAAEHYARAARLDPSFETLKKAREFSWRAGDFASALRLGEDLVRQARAKEDQEKLATALNDHALTLGAQGHYEQAEGLYREALLIDEKTIGTEHPNYAIRLN
ncbi:tetratricopeptide repeat protein, partial [Planktotalea sp.]|uniref:tetratricopeptide repeat protein n=1 Tax=Planktotalea sp. TaxID=2029877 RepID=UPI003D6C27A8